MSPLLAGVLGVVAFLILAFNRMPIGFAFALVGCVGLILFRGLDSGLTILGSTPFAWGTAGPLLPLPLFVLMGQFAFYSGISRDLYETGYKWLGRFPGGIALATNLAATGFAACCGVSMAGAATFGSIAYPEMEKLKYDRKLSTGCIIAGGSLSSLIPPSLAFIIFGFLTETSIAELFIAGILPGIMLSVLNLIAIYTMCKRNPSLGPPGSSFPLKDMLISLKGVSGMLVLFLIVIGGLYAGVFTPTEAGAAGAFGSFVIALVGRRLTFSNLTAAGRDTLIITCFILTMVIGANIFNTFLGVTGLTTTFYELINSLTLPRYLILTIILFIYIPLGMVMDIGAIMLLTIPIVIPPLVNLGFDPVWLGVVTTVLVELGFMTPPVGLNAFVVSGVTKVPLGDVFRGITPFAIIMLIGAIILVAFPQISLLLPSIMG